MSRQEPSDAVIDYWFGSSSLHGWDVRQGCLDRIPILLNDPARIREAGLELNVARVEVELELIGCESDYKGKILEGLKGACPQSSWIVEAEPGKYVVRGGMCRVFRGLALRSPAVKVFEELRLIKGFDKTVVTANTLIRYSEGITNTMPLNYIARKAGYESAPQPPYASLHITLAVVNAKRGIEGVEIKLLGKHRYSSLLTVAIPAEILLPELNVEGLIVVYAMAVLPSKGVDPSIRQKSLSDLRRLGYDIRSANLIRYHFEKYGILGYGDEAVEEIKNYLNEHNISLAGRLGLWRELSIEDIVCSHSRS